MNLSRFKKYWEETAAKNPIPEKEGSEDLVTSAEATSPEVLDFLDKIGAGDAETIKALLDS